MTGATAARRPGLPRVSRPWLGWEAAHLNATVGGVDAWRFAAAAVIHPHKTPAGGPSGSGGTGRWLSFLRVARACRSLTRNGCAMLALLASAALLAASAAPATARASHPFVTFGAGGWTFPSPSTLARLHRAGLKTWRLTMSWGDVSPSPGVLNFSGYDVELRAAARNHIQMLVELTGCPTWACPHGGPPVSASALAGFLHFTQEAVRRYGHTGTVWHGHSHYAVVYWQVFNEVNGADQWPNPSPAAYANVLRATAFVIRQTDRRAKIVLAGLGEKMTIFLRSYLPALYMQPGFKQSFDVMAPEGYAVHTRDVANILTLTRRIMRRFHDTHKPMFITEMSWSTGGPPFPFTTSLKGQANRLVTSWRQLDACRSRWNLRRVYWFSYNDFQVPNYPDYWGDHDGLVSVSLQPKPAYRAFLRFLRPAKIEHSLGRCRLR